MTDKALPPLIVLTGPTASGKSEVGVCLAEALKTEIISADSVQVYRHFDIGSAKPDKNLLDRVQHHLIDIVDPDEVFTLVRFREAAEIAAREIYDRGLIPLVVGGSGLYIKALLEGLEGGAAASEEALAKVESIIKKEGQEGLYSRAKEIDPESMKKIHPNDSFRTCRVVSLFLTSGEKMSDLHRKQKPTKKRFDALVLLLTWDRAALKRRIEKRVDQTLADGWRDEVRRLVKMGYNGNVKPMRSLGYKRLFAELKGDTGCADTAELIKKDTKAFAKRQVTWFRKIEQAVAVPVAGGDAPEDVAASILRRDEVARFLARHKVKIG